jgi:hypothetical protein
MRNNSTKNLGERNYLFKIVLNIKFPGGNGQLSMGCLSISKMTGFL